MRNLKKLLAVVVAICVLATFTVPAFAADTATAAKTDAEIATGLGVILGSGGGVTAEYLATQPDRVQGAIMFLRLKGLESAAKAFTGTDNFSDVEGLNDTNKAILAYLKANPDLGFGGIGNNKFAPTEKMSAKEYYKVLLTALGYTYGTDATADFTWSTVFSFAASKGLVKLIDNETFTVNDLAIGTVEALKATVKGGTDTLIAKLVEDNSISAEKAIASGLYNPVAKALEVVSVKADNLKTAKILFNKELDEDTVVKGNFDEDNDDVVDVKLLDDNKTVLVIFNDSQNQSDDQDIVISGVKATDGTKIADVTKKVTLVDTAIPVVTGAEVKDAKTIVLTVSEPLEAIETEPEVWDDIEVADDSILAYTTFDYTKNTLTFHLSDIMEVGTHKLNVSGLKDYAGYVAVATSFNITVVEDKDAPEIISGKVISNTEIEVTFNENLDDEGDFVVNDDDTTIIKSGYDPDDRAVWRLTFDEKLDVGATVEIEVAYEGQTDVVGNEVKDEKIFKFKVADDTAMPTVTAIIEEGNDITLTFSKAMIDDEGTVTVYDKDDEEKKSVDIVKSYWDDDSDGTEMTIPGDDLELDDMDSATIYIEIAGMKDASIRTNPLTKVKLKLTALDTNTPETAEYYTVENNGGDDDTITFYFTEAMDKDSLKNLSNYRVTTAGAGIYSVGATLASLKKPKVDTIPSDAMSITITAPDIASSTGAGFAVSAVKDKAGNMIDITPVAFGGGATFNVDTVTATGEKEIKVSFDSKVKSFNTSVFTVREGADNSSKLVAYVKSYSIDDRTVTLSLNTAIDTDPTALYLVTKSNSKAKNVFGKELVAYADDSIVDEIAPTVKVSDKSADITTSTAILLFSEEVDVLDIDLFKADIAIRDKDGLYTGWDIVPSGLTGITSLVISGLEANTKYTIAILPRGHVVDTSANANKLAELEKTEFTTKK